MHAVVGESHPMRGVGLAFTMHVILGQSLQGEIERERGGGGGGREKERGRVVVDNACK